MPTAKTNSHIHVPVHMRKLTINVTLQHERFHWPLSLAGSKIQFTNDCWRYGADVGGVRADGEGTQRNVTKTIAQGHVSRICRHQTRATFPPLKLKCETLSNGTVSKNEKRDIPLQ